MAGSILQAARSDARKIITGGGFEDDITLTTPSGDLAITVTGLASKHHLSIDTDGNVASAKNAHVSISETDLLELEYPVRNANEEIALKGHLVAVKDSSGVLKQYEVKDHFPSETLGLIVLILGDWH